MISPLPHGILQLGACDPRVEFAILPERVHVGGQPRDHACIKRVADRHSQVVPEQRAAIVARGVWDVYPACPALRCLSRGPHITEA